MAQGLSTPDPSISPTHLSIRRGRATTTHYTHHQVSLMVSCNTTLVPSLGFRIGPACEAGLSAGMQRECVPPQIRKKEKKKERKSCFFLSGRFFLNTVYIYRVQPKNIRPGQKLKLLRNTVMFNYKTFHDY